MSEMNVIIPAFNEEKGIGAIVRETLQVLQPLDVEVLVVDDGSADRTSQVAEEAGARVVRHPYNKGNGAAVKTGLRNANAEICAIIDADGQHDPKDLARLLDCLGEADMVVGTRVKARYSMVRGVGNWVLNRVASYLSGHPVPDLTSGLRVFRLKVMAPYASLLPNRFSFPSTSTLAFLTDGYSVLFEPIEVNSRVEGSKSTLRPFRDGVKFLTIIVRIVHLFHPLKLYLPLGLTILVGGGAWSLRTILLQNQFSAGGVLLLLAGLIVVLMGFQIDQVSALRRQIGKDSL